MTVPDNASLDIASDVTWSAWIRWGITPGDGNGYAFIMSKSSHVRLYHSSNNQKFQWKTVNDQVQSTTEPLSDQWYHVVGTYDGSIMKIYVDGDEEASQSETGDIQDSANDLHIGCNADDQGREFEGDITDIRIYDTALSSAQVSTLYSNGSGSTGETLDSGGDLVSRWDFLADDYTDSEGSNDGSAMAMLL